MSDSKTHKIFPMRSKRMVNAEPVETEMMDNHPWVVFIVRYTPAPHIDDDESDTDDDDDDDGDDDDDVDQDGEDDNKKGNRKPKCESNEDGYDVAYEPCGGTIITQR